MKPSVFYGFKEMKLKSSAVDRKIVLGFEIIAKESNGMIELSKKPTEVPSFFIRSVKTGGIFEVVVESIEKVVRQELFSCPAGEEIKGGKKEIADVSSMFMAVPVMEADIVVRLPVIFPREVWFSSPTGQKIRSGRAIFAMKPQNFGFLISEKKEFERMVASIEKKLGVVFTIG